MLVQTGKMATLGEMATGIAHELNQPLNVIKIGADFLLKTLRKGELPTADQLRQIGERMNDGTDRAARIINHLRVFGRKADESMIPLQVNNPIRGVFTLVGSQLKERGIRWDLELKDDIPYIMGDANRLEQVFMNLVLNARDAILENEKNLTKQGKKPEKSLRIRSYDKDGRVVVTVWDTGTGVPPHLRAKIFEPFFTTKKVGEGTGIGLSISYGIIREHNGSIEALGEKGEGAVFKVVFPALDKNEVDR
ncbi:MAG: ATP-binding protein [Pseudomonadota bacterium]